MAKLRDWVDLADQTVRNLKPNEVTNLYSAEWLETQRTLANVTHEQADRVLLGYAAHGASVLQASVGMVGGQY